MAKKIVGVIKDKKNGIRGFHTIHQELKVVKNLAINLKTPAKKLGEAKYLSYITV